ncbi:MAG: PilW family protein [Thiohalocapsa sp.]|uniref:PilW family protein n=1 Tax=Thiohalocapsa sp. TaxID=2497641 RepID=UPI0025F5FB3A|nr:PilW family protein [Thiohalocapsa sp.]MCG6940550.1 PilW family protein [Thiohalocapsa sp.]
MLLPGRCQRGSSGQRGLTLVELLIAMFLGLLLISAALAMVVATSRSRGTFDALARTQEAGRFALLMLERDIRAAGYRGCAYGTVNSLLNPLGIGYSNAVYDFDRPFFGWSEADVPTISAGTLPADFNTRYARGDVLLVKNAAESLGVGLAADITTDSTFAQLSSAIDVPVGGLVLVADCTGGGDLFQVTTDDPSPTDRLERNETLTGIGPGNLDPSLHLFSRLYPAISTELLHAQSNLYYVGFARTANGKVTGGTSLRRIRMGERVDGAPPDDELLQGVYDMRVQYGLDLSGNGSADTFRRADALSSVDWEQVVAVRISILAYGGEGTDETVSDEEYTVPFDETIWDFSGAEVVADPDGDAGELRFVPPDRRIYRFFSTTVAVRNRVG